ncbi:MAG TPA: hypothetical protein VGR46_04340, partial [Candidatus Limnocylindria bacterium]|nr:hypothetical protein [Candidatus Limnocylindria bacterium]
AEGHGAYTWCPRRSRLLVCGPRGDSTVRDLVAGSGFNFVDRGAHELKGIPESRQVFAVA